jgi:hypothetical protein
MSRRPERARRHNEAERISARSLRIEARAIIGDDEAEVPVVAREFDFRRRPAAVFHHVVQRLLGDAVEAKRRVGRHCPRHVALGELDGQFVCKRELFAEAAHCGHDAELVELRRMEVVREPMHLGRQATCVEFPCARRF